MAARFGMRSGECLVFHLGSRGCYSAATSRIKRRSCAILPKIRRPLLLHAPGVTIGAGEIRVFGIDVKEIVALEIYLLKLLAISLRKNQVT